MPEYGELIEILCGIDDKEKMRKFFNEIFTPAEQKAFNLRWKLMKMLHEGTSQRNIAKELKISLCKITRGAKIIKDENSVSSQLLNQTQGGSK